MAKFLRHNRTGESGPVRARDGRLVKTEQHRSVTLASATLIGRAQITRAIESKDWQADLWDFFDEIGELRFAVRWLANAISRCTLYVGTYTDEAAEPTPIHPPDNPTGQDPEPLAAALLDELHYGQIGQAEMLRRMALHLSLPGETYLVGLDPRTNDDPTGERRWYVATTDELKLNSRGNSTLVLPDTGQTIKLDPDNSTIIRMWVPHPRRGSEPDSAVRATLPVLREIKGLSDHIAATIDSRLAGAGLLKIPQSASTPNPSQSEPGSTQALHDDPFISALMANMITPIRDRDDASAVVPLVVKVPDEAAAGIEHVDLSTELSEKVAELREAALDRFAAGADLPREIVTGTGSANHWCTLEDVEIMTRDGWRTHDQLTPGQEVLTLNHDTGLSEWQPLTAVNTWQVTDEPMVEITGRRHRSITTTNHRWPTLSGKPGKRGPTWTTSGQWAIDATEGDNPDAQRQEYMLLAAPHADVPTEPKYTDALVEAVAWTYTEGGMEVRPGRNGAKVTLYQSRRVNPDHCASIERALTHLFGPQSQTLDKGGRYASPASVKRWEHARRLKDENPDMAQAEIARQVGVSSVMVGKYLKSEPKKADTTPRWRTRRQGDMNQYVLNSAAAAVIAEHCPNRVVNLDFIQSLTLAQLELFIDVSIRADGHYGNDITPVFSQKDPERNDAFELACILSGRSTVRANHTTEGLSADGPRDKTVEVVRVARTTTFSPRGRSFSTSTHTGTVWCPTTPNGTWLARHEGSVFYTGNSAWQLEESSIKLYVEPLIGVICDALTQQYLWPLMRAAGVDDPTPYVVWYNAAELVQRPNKSSEAQNLWDKGVLSTEALLRENGFGTQDLPEAAEHSRWLAERLALAYPSLIPGLAPLLEATGLGEITAAELDPTTPGPSTPSETDTGQEQTLPGGTSGPTAVASAQPATGQDWWLRTVEQVVLRALELAGKRLLGSRSRAHRHWQSAPRQVLPWDIYTVMDPPDADGLDRLLDGAYDSGTVNFSRDECVRSTVDAYCRHLITTGQPHRREYLATWLTRHGCTPQLQD